MNKEIFRGCGDVFCFTFRQGVLQKNFKHATLGIAIFLFVMGMAINVIMAFGQKKEVADCLKLEVVHVIDESGLQTLYWDGFIEENKERYPKVSFEVAEGSVEETNRKLAEQVTEGKGTKRAGDVLLHIQQTDEGYRMTLYIPEYSVIKEDVGKDFLERVTLVMEQSKLLSSEIPTEKLVYAISGISSQMKDAGEVGRSLEENLIVMLFPMFCGCFIVLTVLVYGESVGNIVTVTVDRPLGSYHPKHKDLYYPVNYGYIEGVMALDVEDKWIVVPKHLSFTKEDFLVASSLSSLGCSLIPFDGVNKLSS